jgi:hypothetical protein
MDRHVRHPQNGSIRSLLTATSIESGALARWPMDMRGGESAKIAKVNHLATQLSQDFVRAAPEFATTGE